MGGTVSSGRDNDELIDNLIDVGCLSTKRLENVFRCVDRGNYYLPADKSTAYTVSEWRSGNLNLSDPVSYAFIMEQLELRPGLSFLNLGSGTGYLSTMVGMVIGSRPANHGIEYYEDVIEYATTKLDEFVLSCDAFDEYDFGPPQFVKGNCLKISAGTSRRYDRIYCGAECPREALGYIKNMMNVGGIAIVPSGSQLLKICKTSEEEYEEEELLAVSFAELISPTNKDEFVDLPELQIPSLKSQCRMLIRNLIRENIHIWKGDLDVRRKKVSDGPRKMRGNFSQAMSTYLSRMTRNRGSDDDEDEDDIGEDTVEEGAQDMVVDEPPAEQTPAAPEAADVTSTLTSAINIKTDRSLSEGADSGIALGTSASSSTQSDKTDELEECVAMTSHSVSLQNNQMLNESSMEESTKSSELLSPVPEEINGDVLMNEYNLSAGQSPHHSKDSQQAPTMNNEHQQRSETPSQANQLSGSPKRQRDADDVEPSDSDNKRLSASCSVCDNQQQSPGPSTSTPAACTCRHSNTLTAQPQSPQEVHLSDSDSSSDDETAEDEAIVLRRREQVFRTLMGVLDDPPEKAPPTAEEDQERLHNRNKAKLYHSEFSEAMFNRILSLPLPPSLKDYLLFYRNKT